jgi:hypothetical protein
MYDLESDPSEIDNLAWIGANRTDEQVPGDAWQGAERRTHAPSQPTPTLASTRPLLRPRPRPRTSARAHTTRQARPRSHGFTPPPPLADLPPQDKEYKRLMKKLNKVFRTRLQPLKGQKVLLNMTAITAWASPKQGEVRVTERRARAPGQPASHPRDWSRQSKIATN